MHHTYMGPCLFPPAQGRVKNIREVSQQNKSMKKQVFKLIAGMVLMLALVASPRAQIANGAASSIPAYYDHVLFTIHFVEFSPAAEKALLQHNKSLNFIYRSDPGLPGGQPFISVIDAIPGDGFNPIWEEVQITFTDSNTPRQLFSDNEVAAAVAAGEITLRFTGEVYWCPVVGQKH
jgi:hypothetical protein